MNIETTDRRIYLIPESKQDVDLISLVFSDDLSWKWIDGVPFNIWVTYDAGENGNEMALFLTPKSS